MDKRQFICPESELFTNFVCSGCEHRQTIGKQCLLADMARWFETNGLQQCAHSIVAFSLAASPRQLFGWYSSICVHAGLYALSVIPGTPGVPDGVGSARSLAGLNFANCAINLNATLQSF